MGDGAAYAYVAMKEAIAKIPALATPIIVTSERTGLVMGSGGPSTSAQVPKPLIPRAKRGAKRSRPLRGAEGHVLHRVGEYFDRVPYARPQLFDLFGLFDQCALHWQRRRAHPMGQARRRLCRRRRRTALDADGFVRCHGGACRPSSTISPCSSVPSVRCRP